MSPDAQTVFFYYFDMAGSADVAQDFGGAITCPGLLGGGTQSGIPSWTSACLQGRCLLFDGQDDVVVTGCTAQPPSSFTLSLSFFPRTFWLEPGSSGAIRHGVSEDTKWTLVAGPDLKIVLSAGTSRISVVRLGEECVTDPVVQSNGWNHLTVVYDQMPNEVSIFVEGRRVKKCTWTSSQSLSPAALEIGDDSAVQDDAFTGMMDDIMLWNEARLVGGPILRFGFEHATIGSDQAWDDTPNNNHAQLEGGAALALSNDDPIYGTYLSLDGSSFLMIPHTPRGDPACASIVSHPEAMDVDEQWRASGGLTMETWVSFHALSPSEQTFLHRATQDGSDDYWWFGIEDGYLVARVGGYRSEIKGEWEPEKNRWYHLAAVYSRSHAWLYVNGRLIAERAVEPRMDPTAQPACIGARCWYESSTLKSSDHLVDASLDNVRVSSGAKTRFDVFEARYDFETVSAGSIPDRSANHHDLELSGDATLTTEAQGWDLRALSFDGGYATIQDLGDALDSDGNLGHGLSVDTWVQYPEVLTEGENETILSLTRTYLIRIGWFTYVPYLTEEVWFGLGGLSSQDGVALTFRYRDATISKRVSLAPGSWHHVGATWDGANLHLFFDGKQVALEQAVSTDDTYASLDFGEAHIGARRVGMAYTATPTDIFAGKLDEFRLSRFAKDLTEDPDGDRMDDSHEIIRSTVRTEGYPQANPNLVNRRAAMVVSGDPAQCFENAARMTYYLLRALGYHEQDVVSYEIVNPDPNWEDLDRCPLDVTWDEDGPDAHAMILSQLDRYAPNGAAALTSRDSLFFNFVDHGMTPTCDATSQTCKGGYQLLHLYELSDKELGQKAAALATYRTVFIMASCFAAAAMDEVGPVSNTIFLAAAAPPKGNGWPWLETIQNGLFGWAERTGDGMTSYEEAFAYTWDVAGLLGKQGRPWLWVDDSQGEDERLGDNGDEWGHNPWFFPADYDPDTAGVDGYRARMCWP
ncbi:MAG: laminin G domain-containing protein [Deltaproteobacteria bacterium]|nr:laminin G domain-containing protein [Deltaproteobacteria bacterium]